MSINLEVGKKYKTRDGKVVVILYDDGSSVMQFLSNLVGIIGMVHIRK